MRSLAPVENSKVRETYWSEDFDAVVVATGHYGAPSIPKFKGIDAWTGRWRDKIIHSRAYRRPEAYAGQNVLIVGTGNSGVDIARDLSPHVNTVYQVTRNSFYGPDQYKKQRAMQRLFLPANGEHVSEIEEFVKPEEGDENIEDGKVRLTDGRVLTNIGSIIFSTGYQYSYPFLADYHRDPGAPVNKAALNTPDKVLITDGGSVRNLYRDVFYNPDPTLTFLGISINTATFSFFEYQALSITRAFAGQAHLPNESERREEVRQREAERGSGKFLHLLGKEGDLAYVKETVQWLNTDAEQLGGQPIEGRSPEWLAVSDQMLAKLTERHGISLSDLKTAIDAAINPQEASVESRIEQVKIDTTKLKAPALVASTEVAIEA